MARYSKKELMKQLRDKQKRLERQHAQELVLFRRKFAAWKKTAPTRFKALLDRISADDLNGEGRYGLAPSPTEVELRRFTSSENTGSPPGRPFSLTQIENTISKLKSVAVEADGDTVKISDNDSIWKALRS